MNSTTLANGIASASRCLRVLVNRQIKSSISSANAASTPGFSRKYTNGATGGSIPRAMVVTCTDAVPAPVGKLFGTTLQVTAFAGSEQLNATLDEKLFSARIDIALVKFAVVPAGTVKLVVPLDATEKSGGPVTMKSTGADVPAGTGSTTYTW